MCIHSKAESLLALLKVMLNCPLLSAGLAIRAAISGGKQGLGILPQSSPQSSSYSLHFSLSLSHPSHFPLTLCSPHSALALFSQCYIALTPSSPLLLLLCLLSSPLLPSSFSSLLAFSSCLLSHIISFSRLLACPGFPAKARCGLSSPLLPCWEIISPAPLLQPLMTLRAEISALGKQLSQWATSL